MQTFGPGNALRSRKTGSGYAWIRRNLRVHDLVRGLATREVDLDQARSPLAWRRQGDTLPGGGSPTHWPPRSFQRKTIDVQRSCWLGGLTTRVEQRRRRAAWATPAPQPQDAPGINAPDNVSPSHRKARCSRRSRRLTTDRSTG